MTRTRYNTIQVAIPEDIPMGVVPSHDNTGRRPEPQGSHPIDYSIPVQYRTTSAEVQNVIDRVADELATDVETTSFRRTRLDSTTSIEEDPSKYLQELNEMRHKRSVLLQKVSTADVSWSPMAAPKIPKEEGIGKLNLSAEAQQEDHLMLLERLLQKLETNVTSGLKKQQVSDRQKRDGLNILKPAKMTPAWLLYLKELVAGFGLILWVAAILCFIAYKPLGHPPDPYNLILGIVLIIVIFVQATFAFVQQQKATNLMASFSRMMPSFCQVLRDGNWININATELVVGDIIQLKEGDKLPADIRVYEVNQGKIEKSSLTGESDPVPLSVTPTDLNAYETHNLALFGTTMLEGAANGIVINTADRTVMGKIARAASNTKTVTTMLTKEINYFMLLIVSMALLLCFIVLMGYFLGIKKSHPGFLSTSVMITDCIAVIVALLPEGLPVAIITILTLVARKMYLQMVLVKKLTVIETLGSATVIASDKTGTITKNQMTVNHLWIMSEHVDEKQDFRLSNSEDKTVSEDAPLPGCYEFTGVGKSFMNPAIGSLLQAMCLCNKAAFEHKKGKELLSRKVSGMPQRSASGNPTEKALLVAADNIMDTDELRRTVPITNEIPFSSRRKFHLTINEIKNEKIFENTLKLIKTKNPLKPYHYISLVKGAPEYILSMCQSFVYNNEEVPLDASYVSKIINANEHLASQGQRVLAFAYRRMDADKFPRGCNFNMDDEEGLTTDLCFIGLAGIIDPPRDGVAEAINDCHRAGVRVFMVTGDQPTTAVAISKAVNIITHPHVNNMADIVHMRSDGYGRSKSQSGSKVTKAFQSLWSQTHKVPVKNAAVVVTGKEIPMLTEVEWDLVLSHREVVFARTTPEQKLKIVKELQHRDEIVAVTGDGVNDSPALKAANLGVAMGICGSDVSKDAANMVLLNDNIVSIVSAIREGRLIFDNLKKVICYLLPAGSFSEMLPVIAAVFFGMPQPLSSFLMIVICVGTDMFGSLGLVHEEAEFDIMHRPPRNARTDRLINLKVILFTYGFVGIMESFVAFFMYFITMKKEAMDQYGVTLLPGDLVFAYENWGVEGYANLTTDQQTNLNNYGQTAYFVALVMCQLWNLLSVRTRYQSILTQRFDKRLLWYMGAEIMIVLAICYWPLWNDYTNTAPIKYYNFLIPVAMGFFILCADELRKLLIRKYPNGLIKKLAW